MFFFSITKNIILKNSIVRLSFVNLRWAQLYNSLVIEYFEPEEDEDNASGEPDVDGLRVGNRGESLLGLHALGLENIIEEWRKFQSFLF